MPPGTDTPTYCPVSADTATEYYVFIVITIGDSSRVVLRTIPKVAGSDYINADFIDVRIMTLCLLLTIHGITVQCQEWW